MFQLEIKSSTLHLQTLHCSFSQSKMSTTKIKVCWMFPNPYRVFLQSWSCNNLTAYLVCNNQQERHQGMEFSTNQGAENSFYEGFEERENNLPHLYLKQVTDVCWCACMLLVCVCVCMYLQNNLKNFTVIRSDHCIQRRIWGQSWRIVIVIITSN